MNLFEYSESVRKKEEGLNSVSFNNQDYLSKARTVAHYIAQTKGEVSIVDVRQALGDIPNDVNPNVMGAVFRGKQWLKIGHTTTTHEAGHARTVGVYILEALS